MAWYYVLVMPKTITPQQRYEVLEWYRQKCALGTQAELAKRLKLSIGSIERILWKQKRESV